jgi:hypothetical protein
MENQTNIFDHSEPTVLAELERVVKAMKDQRRSLWYNYALDKVLDEIAKLKPTEIDKLKQAFAEGGAIPQSAESWVKKFKQ